MKEEEKYDYDQDLTILKSMYHKYFINCSTVPYSISKEIINGIEDLIPNLKFHGHTLTAKILSLLHHSFRIVWKMFGGYFLEMIHPFNHEILNLCMGLWANFQYYYAVEKHDVNKEHDAVDH